MVTSLVPAGLAEVFARDGFVCVRGVLDADEVEQARRAIGSVLDDPSPLALVASGGDDPGRFTEDFCHPLFPKVWPPPS